GDHADQHDDLDFVYSQIKNLRRKLKEANARVEIQAVYGIGYKLVEA
ncbi:MAG: helix-turn-helix domain-containing protein, partial [Flavobacteriales bacterium]